MKLASTVIAVCLCILLLPGCQGLMVGTMGKYFRSDIVSDFDQRNIKKIGLYVFSDGTSYSSALVHHSYYPDEIEKSTSFAPDTSNSGPSLELAKELGEQLESKGYGADIAEGIGHHRELTVVECLEHAKKARYDAVFIVSYAAFTSWYNNGRLKSGFLYVPNAAIFEVNSGDRLWYNEYYGIVQGAHLPSLTAPFIVCKTEALEPYSGKNYIEAAPLAAKILLEPANWSESFKGVPDRGSKTRKL